MSENAPDAIPEEGASSITPDKVDEGGLAAEVPAPSAQDSPVAPAIEEAAENITQDDEDERGTAPNRETEVKPDHPECAPDRTDDSRVKERRSSSQFSPKEL